MTFANKISIAAPLIFASLFVWAGDDVFGELALVAEYEKRALEVPNLSPGDKCPVSEGSNQIVSPAHDYIFGAGGYFFGSGPVYFTLAWKPADRSQGIFDVDRRMPRAPEGYWLKTPWIMNPAYEGNALVRGVRIGSDVPEQVVFRGPDPVGPAMILQSKDIAHWTNQTPRELQQKLGEKWGFWPTSMILPGPGCYAVQIDTEENSDLVVFEFSRPK